MKDPKYIFKQSDALKLRQHGIELTIFEGKASTASVVIVDVTEGHFEEFKNKISTFIYYIINGSGIFVLDDVKHEVQAGDLVVIPPETRIHYFGKMKMTLTVTPAFDEKNEVHVRYVDKSEDPFQTKK